MRRALLAFALLLTLVPYAQAQTRRTADGGILGQPPTPAGGTVGQAPGPVRWLATYLFQSAFKLDTNSMSGLQITSSVGDISPTSVGVAMGPNSPAVLMPLNGNGDTWGRIWEAGAAGATINQKRSDEYEAQFVTGTGACGYTGGEVIVEFCVGDTAFVGFSTGKKPDGFGVLFVGLDQGANGHNRFSVPAGWPRDTWIGFVGNGTDTTFVPLGPENTTTHRSLFYIAAAANNGPVSFYMDGVLKGTISDVARSTTQDNRGWSFSITGESDCGPDAAFGPLYITRNW